MHKSKKLIMKYLPFAFLGIAMLIVHSRIGLDTGDDTWFINQTSVDGFNLLQWLFERYQAWSSRCDVNYIAFESAGVENP